MASLEERILAHCLLLPYVMPNENFEKKVCVGICGLGRWIATQSKTTNESLRNGANKINYIIIGTMSNIFST